MRRIPVIPTLLVLAALALMLRLGFWQLERHHEKEALLAKYAAAQSDQSVHDLADGIPVGYSRVRFVCESTITQQAVSGRSAANQPGWAHVSLCNLKGGRKARVVLGWSERPDTLPWRGGTVVGVVVPRDSPALQVVADPPLAGFAANARPDPRDIPNNHLSYAVQWFLFALTALLIYVLALRKRLRSR